MIIWAIDAGLRGALVVIDGNNVTHSMRMPTIPHPTSKIIKNKISASKLRRDLSRYPLPDKIIIELPEVVNTNARLTLASLFHSIGIIEGVCAFYCDSVHFVTPRKWQCKYNLIGKDKQAAIKAANYIYPELNIKLIKDADFSDAALIGHWFKNYSGVIL